MVLELNSQLKKSFPQDKIIFGGSFINGDINKFSDIDIYIVCDFKNFFYYLKHKKQLRLIKEQLNNNKVNLHIIPNLFLNWKLYNLKGVVIENDKMKEFSAGSNKMTELNSLKLSLKHLICYKLSDDIQVKEKSFHDLKKNFFFLVGSWEADVLKIETELKKKVKNIKTFYFFDWLFYCLRFKKIMLFNFEKNILNCFLNLNDFIDNKEENFCLKFYLNFKKLEKIADKQCDKKIMFKMIDKYTFLIFII